MNTPANPFENGNEITSSGQPNQIQSFNYSDQYTQGGCQKKRGYSFSMLV